MATSKSQENQRSGSSAVEVTVFGSPTVEAMVCVEFWPLNVPGPLKPNPPSIFFMTEEDYARWVNKLPKKIREHL
jgi:hypothetical protein